MKRFVVVVQAGSAAAPIVVVDLEARYAGTSIGEPKVVCSGTSHDTLRKLAALMNEHWT